MMTILRSLTCALFALCFAPSISAATELVSRPSEVRPANFGDSGEIELSADGKWAVFSSNGNGLVTNDHNGLILDVFLRNLETGETILVSGNEGTSVPSGNANSYGATISADGRLVLFESEADNLIPEDDNESSDVFLYDRTTGALSVLSYTTNGFAQGASGAASMTADGRFVLFETDANQLIGTDANNSVDLYRLDRQTGIIDLVSARSNIVTPASVAFPSPIVGTYEASMSADGRFVAFVSAGTNHFPRVPTTAPPQIYLRDMVTRTNAWLTRATNGNGSPMVSSPVVHRDGTFVAFLSYNLGVTTPGIDTLLYIYDIPTGLIRRIQTPAVVEEFTLSENGQYIAFSSTNQIYLHDIATRSNRLASVTPDGQRASGVSTSPVLSSDGRYVVFTSSATNLVAESTKESFQTFRFDRENGEVALLSKAVAGGGANRDTHFPVLSSDGTKAGFMSYASNLVTNENWLGNDVFVVSTSGTNAVALASFPHPLSISATPAGGSFVEGQALSLNGRFVIFSSQAADIVPNDTNDSRDIFLRDLQAGTTRLISLHPDGSSFSSASTLIGASLDANIIAFASTESISGTNRRSIFVYDRATGSNTLASILPAGPAPTAGDAIVSPDGRYLAFRESAPTSPLYISDLRTGATVRYEVPAGVGQQPVGISPGGKYLLTRNSTSSTALHQWQSNRYITNLVGDAVVPSSFTHDDSKVLVNFRASTGSTSLLTLYSLDASGTNTVIATNTTPLAISADGSTVTYQARNATSNNFNIFFYDVATATTTPLTLGGTNVDLRVRGAVSLSADGRFFAFAVTNSLTEPPDEYVFADIFVYDRVLKTITLASQNVQGGEGVFGSGSLSLSANGRVVVFDSAATDLVPADLNLSSDVFLARIPAVDSDADGLEDGWETIYFGGLTATGAADADNDGISNSDELRAGTNPNNAESKFAITMDVDENGITLNSAASPGLTYQLQYRNDLGAGSWQDIGQPVVAFSDTVSFQLAIDPLPQRFFRIKTLE